MKWANSIPWIIAVSGWFATHAFSEGRERRKEIKAQLEKLNGRFIAIESKAITFHTNTEFNSALARELTSELDRIERAISRIQILSVKLLLPFIISHKRSITLQNFDCSDFQQQDCGGELVQEITNATMAIEDEIERQYLEHYPSTFPYFRWPGIIKFFLFWR